MTTMKNKLSWRHHYLPQFYLRSWTGSDGKLWTYREPYPGRTSSKSYFPKEIGYEEHLYTISDLISHEERSDVVETEFFQKLDGDAAPVYRKLLNDDLALSDQERRTWARFVNALRERSPQLLQAQHEPARRLHDEIISRTIRAASADGQSRMSLLQHQLSDARAAERMILEVMIKIINDPTMIDALCDLRWTLCKPTGDFRLLTGDNALVVNSGVDRLPAEGFTLALSPTCLFVMNPPTWDIDLGTASQLLQVHNAIVFHHSQLVVSVQKLTATDIDNLRYLAQAQKGRPRSGAQDSR